MRTELAPGCVRPRTRNFSAGMENRAGRCDEVRNSRECKDKRCRRYDPDAEARLRMGTSPRVIRAEECSSLGDYIGVARGQALRLARYAASGAAASATHATTPRSSGPTPRRAEGRTLATIVACTGRSGGRD